MATQAATRDNIHHRYDLLLDIKHKTHHQKPKDVVINQTFVIVIYQVKINNKNYIHTNVYLKTLSLLLHVDF